MTTRTSKTATNKADSAASHADELISSGRDLAGKLPDAAEAVKGGALEAWRTVETLPKSQQKTFATISFGVGAVLWMFGAPKVLTLLAFIPAFLVATAKATRSMGSGRRRAG